MMTMMQPLLLEQAASAPLHQHRGQQQHHQLETATLRAPRQQQASSISWVAEAAALQLRQQPRLLP
jgi:hypothetical protein